MLPAHGLDGEFFAGLERLDAAIASHVAAARCRYCGGPLHRGDYPRKPRGGLVSAAGEAFRTRYSLCCGRRGCRKRALPPSVRFLGRRVYLEVVVVLAVAFAQAVASLARAVKVSGVPRRTLQRWTSWWREVFPRLPTWLTLRARLAPPPPDEAGLPSSLYHRVVTEGQRPGRSRGDPAQADALVLLARLLAPATTESVLDGSRFLAAVPATE
jgi:hypothetical protein